MRSLDQSFPLEHESFVNTVMAVVGLLFIAAAPAVLTKRLRITRWNDGKLRRLNDALLLPDLPIRVAHRSDPSGTTYIFTDYLSSVSGEWRQRIGRGKTVYWPTGAEWAGDGNDGVARRILLEHRDVGYLELKYAENAGLKYATLLNREGHPVRPTAASMQQAERNTPPAANGGIKSSIVNAPGAESYPIAGFTYLLVYENLAYIKDPLRERALVRFLEWCLTRGQTMAHVLHYAPLPEPLREATLGRIQGISMSPLPQARR